MLKSARLKSFVRLSRLHFLLGGFIVYALGAFTVGVDSVAPYVIGQLAITAAQITAHYLNEYADFEADQAIANRTAFSGGSGVLVSGELPRVVALRAGQVSTAVCAVACVPLALVNPLASGCTLLALAISWAYSMPPVRLLNTGWGELATALTVAGLVPLTGALAQDRAPTSDLWWMIVALVSLQMTMLLAFELPDLESDKAAGKHVLGTRVGARNTQRLMAAGVSIAAVAIVAGAATGQLSIRATIFAVPAVIPAVLMAIAARNDRHGLLTLGGVATFFLAAVGFLVAAIS